MTEFPDDPSSASPFWRLQELVGADTAPSVEHVTAEVGGTTAALPEETVHRQLSGSDPLSRDTSDALAATHGLTLAADWLFDYLSDTQQVDNSEVAHIRTVRKLIGAGHVWRRILRD